MGGIRELPHTPTAASKLSQVCSNFSWFIKSNPSLCGNYPKTTGELFTICQMCEGVAAVCAAVVLHSKLKLTKFRLNCSLVVILSTRTPNECHGVHFDYTGKGFVKHWTLIQLRKRKGRFLMALKCHSFCEHYPWAAFIPGVIYHFTAAGLHSCPAGSNCWAFPSFLNGPHSARRSVGLLTECGPFDFDYNKTKVTTRFEGL